MLLLLKNLVFTLLIPGAVAFYIPLRIADSRFGEAASNGSLPTILALPVLLLGTAVYLWCLWDFAVFGRGTPAPIDAPKRLVVRGLYRYVRNPMYIGVLTVIVGWALFFGDTRLLVYAAGVAVVFHTVVVVLEEPMLRRQFGDSYQRYCAAVGRWIPKLRGNEGERPDR
jgi:protein-S-isoprenylcysteine O-methyltransferase Ste14